jgi:Holliday junction resolvase RusA-like endonuclease
MNGRSFFIPGQPQGKGRAKVTMRGRFPHAYTPEKTASYESLIMAMYLKKYPGSALLDGPLRMVVTARYTMPKASGVKTRKMISGEILPTTKPDLDNLLKCICDAGNKVIFRDDTQIVDLRAYKAYGEVPGVYVSVCPVGDEIPFYDPLRPTEDELADLGRPEE